MTPENAILAIAARVALEHGIPFREVWPRRFGDRMTKAEHLRTCRMRTIYELRSGSRNGRKFPSWPLIAAVLHGGKNSQLRKWERDAIARWGA